MVKLVQSGVVQRNAVLYVRVSDPKQAKLEGSLDTQAGALKNYVASRRQHAFQENWSIVGVYREEGKSAKEGVARPELQRMLSAIRSGEANTILVTKMDRLVRSLVQFLDLWRMFEEYEVTLISLAESFDTSSPMGRAMLKMVVLFAEMERERIAERVREGVRHRMDLGYYVGGPTLGYDFDPANPGKLVVNQDEAAQVVHLFEQYLELGSLAQVQKYAARKGVVSKQYVSKRQGLPVGGAPFSLTQVKRMLTNPLYVGLVPNSENELITGKHEPIVPERVWKRVQRRVNAQVRTRHNANEELLYGFFLKGIISCGQCQSSMTPRYAYGRSQRYYYYSCTNRTRHGTAACSLKDVPAPALDEAFLGRLKELGEQAGYVRHLSQQKNLSANVELEQLELRRKALERELAELHRRMNRWTDLLSLSKQEGAERTILHKIGEAEAREAAIRAELEELAIQKSALRERTVDPAQVCKNIHQFAELLDHAEPAEKRALVGLMVHKVIWTPEEVKYALYEQPSPEVLAEAVGAASDGSLLSEGWCTTSQTQRTNPAVLWATDQVRLTPVGRSGALAIQIGQLVKKVPRMN